MFLLIDHEGKLHEEFVGERRTFETATEAQDYADARDEPDWMIVKFVAFT